MNITHAARRVVLCLVLSGLVLSVVDVAAAAQSKGGVRSDGATADSALAAGQTLEVTVSLKGRAAANVTVAISTSDGTTIASGSTSSSGIFSTMLATGTYNVTATSGSKATTKSIRITGTAGSTTLALAL